MRSRELMPCEPLRPYLRLLGLREMDEPASFGPAERISPDGLLEMVFHYCGYYDQSHFTAAFKTFSGITPRQFLVTDKLSYLELD